MGKIAGLALVFWLVGISASATSLSWSAATDKDFGYKIYWALVDDCQDLAEGDFVYSVDVGSSLTYNFSNDPNFQTGKNYLMRLVTYNAQGQESEQSSEVVCVNIEPPQPPRDLKKKN